MEAQPAGILVAFSAPCYIRKSPERPENKGSTQHCQGSGVGSIPTGCSIISDTYSNCIFSVGLRRTNCCSCRWMNQSNQLQMGCPFSRGQSLRVRVQRQSAVTQRN